MTRERDKRDFIFDNKAISSYPMSAKNSFILFFPLFVQTLNLRKKGQFKNQYHNKPSSSLLFTRA